MTEHTIINLINNTSDKAACYILHGDNGDLLIDTGYFRCRNAVDEFVSQYNVKWIFLTHGHFDHVWNAAYLKEKYGCKVLLHQKDGVLYDKCQFIELKPTRKRYKLVVMAANAVARKIKFPVCEVDYYISDRDTDFLKKLGFDAEIIMLPGHTYGSMGVLSDNVLYAGDACSGVGAHYRTVYLGMDVEMVRESEKKIRRMKPDIICPGHGRPINFAEECRE